MHKFEELLLHIGLHKTGTTTIQHQMMGHEEAFEAHDLAAFAPLNHQGNSSYLIHAILDVPLFDGKRVHPRIIGDFEHFAKQSRASRLLLSGEDFSLARIEQWEKLMDFFQKWLVPGASIRIFMVVRHPEAWAISMENQSKKSLGLEANPVFGRFSAHLLPLVEYLKNSPRVQLEVKRYEDLIETGFWADFLDWMALPCNHFPMKKLPQITSNASVSMESKWILAEFRDPANWPRKVEVLLLPGTPDGLTQAQAQQCWLPGRVGPGMNAIVESVGLVPYRPGTSWVVLKNGDLFNRHCIRSWKKLILTLKPEDQRRIQHAMRRLARQPHMRATSVSTRFRFALLRLWVGWKQMRGRVVALLSRPFH